jgi:hypothetical protein
MWQKSLHGGLPEDDFVGAENGFVRAPEKVVQHWLTGL